MLVCTLLGGLGKYLVAFLAVFLHESAHYAVAHIAGAKEMSVTLMPYGAALNLPCDVPHFGAILLAGPFSNVCAAAFCLAASWLFPEVHGYLRSFIVANVHIALVNALPAYPLDGGRLLREIWRGKGGRVFTSTMTLASGLAAIALFFFFDRTNYTLVTFGVFLLSYFFAFSLQKSKVCAPSDPLYAIVSTDREGRLRPVRVREKGKTLCRLRPDDVTALVLKCDRECMVGEALSAVGFLSRVK